MSTRVRSSEPQKGRVPARNPSIGESGVRRKPGACWLPSLAWSMISGTERDHAFKKGWRTVPEEPRSRLTFVLRTGTHMCVCKHTHMRTREQAHAYILIHTQKHKKQRWKNSPLTPRPAYARIKWAFLGWHSFHRKPGRANSHSQRMLRKEPCALQFADHDYSTGLLSAWKPVHKGPMLIPQTTGSKILN